MRKDSDSVRVNFTVPREVKAEIDTLSIEYGISASEYWRRLISFGKLGESTLINGGKIVFIDKDGTETILDSVGKFHPFTKLPKLGEKI